MNHLIGKKVLVTTKEWFYAPNGVEHRAVHGTLKSITSSEGAGELLLEVGNCIFALSHVLTIIQCNEFVHAKRFSWAWHEGEIVERLRPCATYITD